jgi:hypothetical protein
MKSMINYSRYLAAAMCVATLAGCNAVEDVRSEPFVELPAAKVVLQGSVTGLGSRRSMTIRNRVGLYAGDTVSVTAPVPVQPTVGAPIPSTFSYGALNAFDPDGNPVPYDLEISQQPYGKLCVFVGGTNVGVLNPDVPTDVRVQCGPAPGLTLYSMTVTVNPSFASTPGAAVFLRTEDALYSCNMAGGNDPTLCTLGVGTVTFPNKLMNTSGNTANGPIATPNPGAFSPVFEWAVTASVTTGGVASRCPVTNPSNPLVGANVQNPSANISTPAVLACSFTISGATHYSRPAGVTTDPTLGAGLALQLKDLSGNIRGNATVAAGAFPAAITFNNALTPVSTVFTASPDATFQVVVTSQPANQTCIVPNGGFISLNALVRGNPVSVTPVGTMPDGNPGPSATGAAVAPAVANTPLPGTRLVVLCRNKPASADALKGVYRLTKTTALIERRRATRTFGSSTTLVEPITDVIANEWQPFDLTVQNNASSNILSFSEDGTFLYGTHQASTQVEQGFYEYSATLPATTVAGAPPGRLRFTLHTDTQYNTTFPTAFSNAEINGGGTSTTTAGISALPGALTFTTLPNSPFPIRHANMGAVVKTAASGTTAAKIVARSGPYGGAAGTYATAAFTFAGPIPAPAVPTPAAPTETTPTTTATNSAVQQVDWELTEVQSLNGQMTGAFVSQYGDRVWVYDKDTSYGYHLGVNGFPNIQSACFTIQNPTASSGTFERRGSSTGCYAINRPRTVPFPGQDLAQIYFFSGAEAVDNTYTVTTHTSSTTVGAPTGAATASPTTLTTNTVNLGSAVSAAAIRDNFAAYEARIPGGESAIDGRSPSPIYYFVAPAASFFSSAPAEYFPTPTVAVTTWCSTEILGIRRTLNGIPTQQPVYMCRTRVP